MGGKRVPEGLLLVAATSLIVGLAPLAAAPPAVAVGSNMCEPTTSADLAGPSSSPDTTLAEIDLIDQGRARGHEPGSGGSDPEPEVRPPSTRPPRNCTPFVYDMEFPLLGAGDYASGFGAARDGGRRQHMGVDLMAPQLTPIVAVADGVVSRIRHSDGSAGMYIMIDHDDGWSSWYLHLNNDSYDTDDGRGLGIRPGLEEGAEVEAGELIGWVGDSGNAETTAPHLHFELHDADGRAIDPYGSIVAAERKGAAAFATPMTSEQDSTDGAEVATIDLIASRIDVAALRPGFDGAFVDDDGLVVEPLFNALTAMGVSLWCDDWGVRVCPGADATGGDAESWIATVVGTDRDPSVAIGYDLSQLDPGLDRSAVIACGLNTLCPDSPVSFGEVAAMLVGASDGVSVLSPLEASKVITRIGIAGCGGPQSPDRFVSRAELGQLILRSMGEGPASGCGALS